MRKGVVEELIETRARSAYRAAVVGVIEPDNHPEQNKRHRRISPATAAPRFPRTVHKPMRTLVLAGIGSHP